MTAVDSPAMPMQLIESSAQYGQDIAETSERENLVQMIAPIFDRVAWVLDEHSRSKRSQQGKSRSPADARFIDDCTAASSRRRERLPVR